jgi:hypothetical protein
MVFGRCSPFRYKEKVSVPTAPEIDTETRAVDER